MTAKEAVFFSDSIIDRGALELLAQHFSGPSSSGISVMWIWMLLIGNYQTWWWT